MAWVAQATLHTCIWVDPRPGRATGTSALVLICAARGCMLWLGTVPFSHRSQAGWRVMHMGKIDAEAKAYLSDNARFADAFNFLLYGGDRVIDPDALQQLDPTEIALPYGNDAREAEQRYRDLLKSWQAKTDGEAVYLVALGTEIQHKVHYAMPVKNSLYDALFYARQVSEAARSYRDQSKKDTTKQKKVALNSEEFLSGFRKEDRLMPVITLTLFLSDSEWDGPCSIHDMFRVSDPRLLDFVPDYRINLVAPTLLSDEDIYKFRTDLSQLLEFIKHSRDKDALYRILHKGDRYRHLDVDVANLIKDITGADVRLDEREGKVDMCEAIEEMKRETADHIGRLMKNLSLSATQAMDALGIPAERRAFYMAML